MALNYAELAVWGTGGANVESAWRSMGSVVQPTGDVRQQVVALALEQVGKPYILGTKGPNSFDCSGLVEWTYAQYGVQTTSSTFTQLKALRDIDPSQLQTGDMVYFQYPWDQHTGILADLNNDQRWDMIHAAAPGVGVTVEYDVFSKPFYTDAIIGYRTAL
jgi:cell wall-associated NlpC family hydrolase